MKKSNLVQIVLLTAVLSACNTRQNRDSRSIHIRTDSTASYTRSGGGGGSHGRYYVFRPYGTYDLNGYHKSGYYSSAISENSNIGHNSNKSGIIRGGFGRSGFRVSS